MVMDYFSTYLKFYLSSMSDIADYAIKKGSTDNISIIIIFLNN